MNPQDKLYLKLIKERLIPKYGLDFNKVSFQYRDNLLSVYYLVSHVEQDKVYEYYKVIEKFYEEANLLCRVVTQNNLNTFRVFCDVFNNEKHNLLLSV
jgi:hypothetical protein